METIDLLKGQSPQIEINPESIDFTWRVCDELSNNRQVEFRLGGTNMKPTINYQEMVTLEPILSLSVRKGDIVLHTTLRQTAVLQRVVRFIHTPEGKFVITRGDNSRLENPAVPIQYVIGRATKVRRDGKEIPLINSRR